jgi:hypothetical protein
MLGDALAALSRGAASQKYSAGEAADRVNAGLINEQCRVGAPDV